MNIESLDIIYQVLLYCFVGGTVSGIFMATTSISNIYHLAFIALVWPLLLPIAIFNSLKITLRFFF